MDEKAIIKGCINNDRKAQELLYRQYFGVVKAMCLRYTTDEDYLISIINDGFLRVFKGIHTYKGSGSFEGWIRRTVYHALSDFFRKQNRYTAKISFIEKDRSVKEEALQDLYFLDLVDLIQKLPSQTYTVFKLYAMEGFSHKEISEKMGIPLGTSKWHLFEARKQLKAMLQNQNKYTKYAN